MIDFHAHLDLYPDPHTVARECVVRDLYVLSVTTTPSAWSGTAALTTQRMRRVLEQRSDCIRKSRMNVKASFRCLSACYRRFGMLAKLASMVVQNTGDIGWTKSMSSRVCSVFVLASGAAS
nr:hypothetical protein [Paracoccus pantotrophus]